MATLTTETSRRLLYVDLNVWVNSQNVNNNTSNIGWSLVLRTGSAGWATSWDWSAGSIYATIYIDGLGYKTIDVKRYNYSGQYKPGSTFDSGSFDVEHNTDGTKTLTYKVSFTDKANGYNNGKYYTPGNANEVSSTLPLTRIPRASQLSDITMTLNTEGTITWTKYADFTHELKYKIGDFESNLTVNSNQTSSTFTPSYDLASYITDNPSGIGTLTLTTKNGTEIIGTSTSKITFIVPDNSITKPTATITIDEATTGIKSKFGAYIKGKSKLNVSITGTGYKGATISSYSSKVSNNIYTGNNFITNILNESGTVETTITDSRGIKNTIYTNYTVLDYSAPTLSVNVERNDNEPSKVIITYNSEIYTLNNKNDKTLKFRYKKVNDIEYSDYTYIDDFTIDDSKYVANGTYTLNNIDEDEQYEFEILLSDYFSSITKNGKLNTSFQLMNFNVSGNGLAFGKVADNNLDHTIEIADSMTLLYHNKSLLDITYPIGSIYISVSSTSPASLFGGTWESWGNGKVPVGIDTSDNDFKTVEQTGGEKTHTLTVNEMPTHTHNYVSGRWTFHETSGGTDIINPQSGTSYMFSRTTNSAGDNQAHNNLQPYITCYMWKRTA